MNHIDESLTVITKYKEAYDENYQFLMENKEISFAMSYQTESVKSAILSMASFFEKKIIEIIYDMLNSNCEITKHFIHKRALERQYHQLFNWSDPSSANQFLSLFGNDFKKFASTKINQNEELKDGVRSFIQIGALRNKLVHDDYATHRISLSIDEAYSEFQKALNFVNTLKPTMIEFKQLETVEINLPAI